MIRSLLAKLWTVVALAAILAAILLSLARLLLPYIDRYHEEIVAWVSGQLRQPVAVSSLEAEWHGFGPRLKMRGIRLFDEESGAVLMQFGEAELGIDLFYSLASRSLRIDTLTVTNIDFAVIRAADGTVSIGGIGVAPSGEEADGRRRLKILAWLSSQDHLVVEQAAITWLDQTRGGEVLHFLDVGLELRNRGARHQLTGAAALPVEYGGRVSVAVDLEGDMLARGWGGQAYFSGDGLQVAQWLRGRRPGGIGVDKGSADVSLWSVWRAGKLEEVTGTVALTDAALSGAPSPAAGDAGAAEEAPFLILDSAAASFAWRRAADGWHFRADQLRLKSGAATWPASELALSARTGAAGRTLSARLSYADLRLLDAVLRLSGQGPPALRRALEGLHPGGALHAVRLDYRDADGVASHRLQARFSNLHGDAWGAVPELAGFDGELTVDDGGGAIEFRTSAATVRFAHLFREALPVAALHGRLRWRRTDGAWRIAADDLRLENEDLRLRARLALEIPADGQAPVLGLFARFDAATLEHTSRYLPAAIMPPASVRWLDRAIIGGRAENGALLVHGPLAGFPYDHGEGRFEVRFDVCGGVLDYAPGWPRIDAIDAQVAFSGRGFALDAAAGTTVDSRISRAQVVIADLAGRPALLEIDGAARGEAADGIRFLRESPLRQRFAAYIDGAVASGSSALHLAVRMPLAAEAPAAVQGTITLENSGLVLGPNGVELSGINGQLRFTEAGLEGRDIAARLLGLDARIAVRMERRGDVLHPLITAAGAADAEAISGLLDLPLLRRLNGATGWSARLRITESGAGIGGELRIDSDLRGLAIDLPPPLGKSRTERRRLVIDGAVPRARDRPIHARLGNVATAVFDLDPDLQLERGTVSFGAAPAQLAERAGLRITGELPALSFSEWQPLFGAAGGPDGGAPGITSVDLKLARAEVFHRHFTDVEVGAEQGAQAWVAEVRSKELAGRIELPRGGDLALRMDLEYLRLGKGEEARDGEQLDPRAVPALRITSRQFSYNDIDFGGLDLAASQRPAGLHLDKLTLRSSNSEIDARGDWVTTDGEQYSSFTIAVTSENLDRMLRQMGYADAIKKGRSRFDIVARWEGPPTEFALARLDGTLYLKVEDGRLLDVEPGAGRIFGLISIQALPRRLSLDFSDFFKKGFTFDRVEGNFSIKDGIATTRDLYMEGPAARIEADGRIDLAAGQYDQLLTVIPQVSAALPMAGVLTGGIGVGAAILLVERMLKPNIDKITRIRYHVTGPWGDPVVTRLQESPG